MYQQVKACDVRVEVLMSKCNSGAGFSVYTKQQSTHKPGTFPSYIYKDDMSWSHLRFSLIMYVELYNIFDI